MVTGAQGDVSRWIDQRMALAREWDELVEQVRKLEGFEDFLRPPPLDTLLGAAARGPVVVVNVSRWRCDALMVTTDGVRVAELPDLTSDEVERRTVEYLRLLHEDARVDPGLPFTVAVRQRATKLQERESALRSTMEWLWEVVADPVLAALGITQPHIQGEPWYRLWWCPTGLLTLLPLHGAGYHSAADGRTVLDRVVSSYTPTLRVLREAMEMPVEQATAGSDRLLFVGVPDTPDQLQLAEEVAGEREFLRGRFPSGLTVIEGGNATVSTVQAAMAQHRWIHLSCHGHQDLNDPSTAGFVLSSGTFSITRLSAMHYTGEFAFLSACKTATGGLNLPDEVITLAAALSYTGYRYVLATLWSVDPAVAMEVTEAVYPRLINDGVFDPDKSALALHHAVRMLRAGGRPLDDWLPFTHNGP